MRPAGLSILTIGYGAYIVVSASFMLQVNMWLTSAVGDPFLARAFWVGASVALAFSAVYALTLRAGAVRLVAVLCIFALAYLVGRWQAYFAEKTHILTYGLLGYLAARDLAGAEARAGAGGIAGAAGALKAVACVALVSACDETFQLLLPYRFGDLKDFATNIASGALGIALLFALRGE